MRHELRIIAPVEGNHTVEFFAFQHGPASTLRRVILVVAVPGPFDGRLPFSCGRLAVHVPVDVAEVKLAAPLLVELEEAFFLLVDVRLVSGAHRDDAPAPLKRGWRFRFLCHWSLSSLPIRRNVRNQPFLECHDLGFSWSISDVHQQAVDTQHPDQRVGIHSTRHRPSRVKAPQLE
jgi:hypothetical protein